MSIISSQHVNHFQSNLSEAHTLAVEGDGAIGGSLVVGGSVATSSVAVTGAVTAATVSATGLITAVSGTAPAPAATEAIKLGGTGGPSIYFGNGIPTATATKGSLYINSTAVLDTTRLYINTDGAATWASFTASV